MIASPVTATYRYLEGLRLLRVAPCGQDDLGAVTLNKAFLTLISVGLLASLQLLAQSTQDTELQDPSQQSGQGRLVERHGAVDKSNRLRSEYDLGPGDVITVQVADDETFKGKPIRVSSSGTITLPLIGRLTAAGMTATSLEDEISAQLSKYMVNPQVSVTITDFRSQPVSVLGSVNKPGVYQLEGPRTVAEMIAMAGGLTTDAGFRLKLTRETQWGDIPIKGAVTDADQKYNTAILSLSSIEDGSQPGENIQVRPFDVIYVPKGQMVYVMGEVNKSGGFILHDQGSISVLEAVSLAGGYGPRAAPQKAKILRSIEGQEHRQEVDLNLKAVASGQAPDIRLMPKDVLVIPNDAAREIRTRVIEAAIGIGTGILIWRR